MHAWTQPVHGKPGTLFVPALNKEITVRRNYEADFYDTARPGFTAMPGGRWIANIHLLGGAAKAVAAYERARARAIKTIREELARLEDGNG